MTFTESKDAQLCYGESMFGHELLPQNLTWMRGLAGT